MWDIRFQCTVILALFQAVGTNQGAGLAIKTPIIGTGRRSEICSLHITHSQSTRSTANAESTLPMCFQIIMGAPNHYQRGNTEGSCGSPSLTRVRIDNWGRAQTICSTFHSPLVILFPVVALCKNTTLVVLGALDALLQWSIDIMPIYSCQARRPQDGPC